MKHVKTLKVRVKDKHCKQLNEMARSVNFVWNYINELSYRAIKERGMFLSAFDLHPYTKGANKELGLHSHTVQQVSKEYTTRRKQFKKVKLSWRKSSGVRRSLGWIPINTGAAKWKNGQVYFNGNYYKVWDSYGLSQYKFRSGSFNEDSRGRWYFNVVVEVETEISKGQDSIGIDLGLKDIATCSDGTKLEEKHFYREMESKLKVAQRAKNKKRVRAIHAKIKNRRKDALHKFSRELVNRSGLIVIGNVKSSSLTKTKMAKSVLDAGWSMLKTMLSYKCDHAGIVFKEVNEAYTTQTCSNCGSLPHSRPKGIAGLGMREWVCSECGVTHDRDVNAAKNILALGHERPVEGIPALKNGEDVKLNVMRCADGGKCGDPFFCTDCPFNPDDHIIALNGEVEEYEVEVVEYIVQQRQNEVDFIFHIKWKNTTMDVKIKLLNPYSEAGRLMTDDEIHEYYYLISLMGQPMYGSVIKVKAIDGRYFLDVKEVIVDDLHTFEVV